jgi:hypothetical protein
MHRSSIGLEIILQSAFTAFRVRLPSANYIDLVGCGTLLQIVTSLDTLFKNLKHSKQLLRSAAGAHTSPSKFNVKKSVLNGYFYL